MNRRKSIVLLLLGIAVKTLGQQDPMYSEYVFNQLIINPAYAGTHDVLSTTLLYRNQWVNIPGAPQTGILSIDAPIKNKNVGVGLNVEFDKIGVTKHTGITGIYSYKIKFVNSSLAFGLQAGVGFSNSNFTSVNYSENGQGDVAFQNNFHDVLPNIGFGIYYNADRFFAGLSIPQIAGYAIQNALYHKTESAQLDLSNHYFLSTGYIFNLSPDIKLKPSVLLKYVKGAPLEIDINTIVSFYDIMALGVSYRSLASVDFLAQVKITNQVYVGYAYEYSTTRLNTFSSGSHEIMVQYFFDFSHAKIITPRFF
ncbi:MAG: type IX secretion system membrane protein PorP/SprF [Bacteroidota bacterium]